MKKILSMQTLKIAIAIILVIAISFGSAIIVHKKGSRPVTTTVTNGLSAYELAVENGYNGTVQEWLESLQGKSAYEIAVDGGYEGSENEWSTALTKLANSNAVGIQTASFNSKGELLLTLTDETKINLGKAVGVNGTNGKDGKDGTNGKDGVDGKDGTNGNDGIGISDVDINDVGELVLSFSDSKSVNLGKIVGASGLNGLSAYEIAVLTGKTVAKTEEDWIDSLKGEKGPAGAAGAQGDKGDKGDAGPQGEKGETGPQGLKGDKGDTGLAGDTPYIKDGNWWIGTTDTGITAQGPQGQAGATGDKGDKGDKGDVGSAGAAGLTPHIDTNGNWWIGTTDTGIRANGKSAYEVALENNPNLTYEQWTESIKGATGANGKSAYELAVETGLISSTVTVENWLASLKGANGKDGISPVVRIHDTTNEWEISIDGGVRYTSTGVKATGEKGEDGQDGAKGETGARGADGISPKIRINDNNEWEVSIDNGNTYTSTGVKATGEKGSDGQNGAKGDDGLTPEIKGGTWWIGETNTGVVAEGKNGKDAIAPQIRIDLATNMWEISTNGGESFLSTNVKATGDKGADGKNGANGESAYEIAKRLGLTTADSETAWIETLKGANGKDGQDGIGIDNITLENGVMTITLTNSEKVYRFENLKGADGITPQLIIENGKWKVSYNNGASYTELGDAKGADGITPTITEDGYWQFGNEKSSYKAVAKDGVDGITPQLKIENDQWYLSTDNGATFKELGTAKGEKGDQGISPSIKNGYWYIGEENTNVPATGANGADGKNGNTPILKIENDYWFVSYDNSASYIPLNVKAVGANGQNGADGKTPEIIGGYWYIGGESTGVKAEGVDGINGKTPYIQNNTWWIDGVDTAITAVATNGENGKTPEIGANGNWWIDGVDTGKKAVAQDGANGEDGEDGDGIVGVTVNEDNFLVIDMKFGEDIIIEKSIVGPAGQDGDDGKDGNGIKSITLNANDELVIETDNGTTTLGPIRGKTGAKGTGIKSIALNENFELVFTMDDEAGTTHTVTGSLKGADGVGVEEVKIEDGNLKIKYTNSDTFVDLGNVKGEQGDPGKDGADGAPGADGRGIADVEIIDGHLWITYTDDLENPVDLGVIGKSQERSGQLIFVLLDDGTYGVKAATGFTLSNVVIPNTYNDIAVTQIIEGGFKNQTSITSVSLPESLKKINRDAFSGCTGLNEIIIPESTEFIGAYAFYGSGLTSATLSNAANWLVGTSKFSYTYITYSTNGSYCKTTLISTKKFDISDTSKAALALTDSIEIETLKDARTTSNIQYSNTIFYWFAEDWTCSKRSVSVLKYVLQADGTYSVKASDQATSVSSIEIPATYRNIAVTSIAENGFKDLTNIETIILPNSVTSINKNAFSGCSNLSITIPESVKSILPNALKNVKEITVEGTNTWSVSGVSWTRYSSGYATDSGYDDTISSISLSVANYSNTIRTSTSDIYRLKYPSTGTWTRK